jgi:hypothetical protein
VTIGGAPGNTMMRVVQRSPSVASTQTRPSCNAMNNARNASESGRPRPKIQSAASHDACIATITG